MGTLHYLPMRTVMRSRITRVDALRMLCAALVTRTSLAIAAGPELMPEMVTTEAPIAGITTHHTTTIGTERIAYTATFAETVLRDAQGKPQATISATSYVRDSTDASATRPIVFAFNGGPGASSSPLHFGAFGPRRWSEEPGQDRTIVPNGESLIDVADLVFIDPVGTGFSRMRPDGDPTTYWSIAGDADAALTLIRTWLRDQRRTQSPVFIAGESYGGFRLATFANDLGDLPIAGLILISPLLDASAVSSAPGNDLPFVFELPSLAAGAWHHERIDRKGRTVAQFYDEVAAFAQSDYLVALQKGSALPASDRTRIAARMASYIGLPQATIEAANLRIDSEQFLQTLLADKKLLVGRLDMRVTAPKPTEPPKDPHRAPAADDPALGLKGANVIRSAAIKSYFERDLNVKTARDYLSLTLEVNFRWNWQAPGRGPQFYVNPTPNIAQLMNARSSVRLLLLGGYFDLATPALGPRYALLHAGVPPERLTMKAFVSGHSPADGANRARVSEVVHAFVRNQ
jgi:carboxypeptidase C (cathepsin A)